MDRVEAILRDSVNIGDVFLKRIPTTLEQILHPPIRGYFDLITAHPEKAEALNSLWLVKHHLDRLLLGLARADPRVEGGIRGRSWTAAVLDRINDSIRCATRGSDRAILGRVKMHTIELCLRTFNRAGQPDDHRRVTTVIP